MAREVWYSCDGPGCDRQEKSEQGFDLPEGWITRDISDSEGSAHSHRNSKSYFYCGACALELTPPALLQLRVKKPYQPPAIVESKSLDDVRTQAEADADIAAVVRGYYARNLIPPALTSLAQPALRDGENLLFEAWTREELTQLNALVREAVKP